MKIPLLVLVVITLTMLALGCTSSTQTTQQTQSETKTNVDSSANDKIPLTIINSKLGIEYGELYIITGLAQANKDLRFGEIDAKFYDKDGAVLESHITTISNLKSGEKWNFKIGGPKGKNMVANY
jgi:hypothetical protein